MAILDSTRRLSAFVVRQIVIGLAILTLGGLALLTAFLAPEIAPFVLGVLMLLAAVLQAVHALFIDDVSRRRAQLLSAGMSAIVGLLLVAWGELVFSALAGLLGISWLVDGAGKLIAAAQSKRKTHKSAAALAFDGAISIVIGLSVGLRWPFAGELFVFLAVGLRLTSMGWSILLDRTGEADATSDEDEHSHPDALLGLPPNPRIAAMREGIELDERHRWATDLYWVATLLVAFFAIHVSRLESEWTLVGMFSPAVAVFGDCVFALGFAYLLIVPVRLLWRLLTRPVEKRAWNGIIAPATSNHRRRRLTEAWLSARMRFSLRYNALRHSPSAAIRRGLGIGLPPTAVLVAIVPLLGVSWYFNTESWATGAWNHWSAHRTDGWRQAMMRAVETQAKNDGAPLDDLFQVHPAGLSDTEDFSFLVIGDTGEGDASQHVLRDQFLRLGQRADVKFLVLSSDVIYPQGAMRDYEAKFYLPFKGFEKPIYAIPGNHDWYDALEAFSANFFTPQAAGITLRARREADHRVTSTTEATIDGWVKQAQWLRQEYGLLCGLQRAPFFEIQTAGFALIAVDSGVLRTIDEDQMRWIKAALERAKGKFIFVIPGHPFFAGGGYVVESGDNYDAFHKLLRESGANVVMAGDTHDFEFYRESYQMAEAQRSLLHFVNGGGGAYISIGTSLDWPKNRGTADSAFYPRADAVIEKLNRETPWYKLPLWWWVKKLHGWPSTTETLASAFASNRAPFFQCFVEVKVERSTGQVRILPHTATGPMRWKELEVFGQTMPPDRKPQDAVEFVVPMGGK